VLPSNGSNYDYAKWTVPFPELGLGWKLIVSQIYIKKKVLTEHRIFAFSLIIEATTEKALQFLMPIKSIFNQNLGFDEKNVFLNTTERFKQYKIN
jgi:hypothetical protein